MTGLEARNSLGSLRPLRWSDGLELAAGVYNRLA
jgi:hypothetical protein